MKIGDNDKFDLSKVSTEGLSAEDLKQLEKKNSKLIDIFKAFDANGNGQLEKIELARAMDTFSKLDQDNDGKISRKEFKSAAESLNAQGEFEFKVKDLKSFLKFVRKATKGDETESTQDVINAANAEAKAKAKAEQERLAEQQRLKLEQQQRLEQQLEEQKRLAEQQRLDAEKAEQERLEQFTSYTVQNGDRLEDILKRSLEARGIEPTDENLKKAKADFIKENPNAIKKNDKFGEYLLAGTVIKVQGGLENKKNSEQVMKEWQEIVNSRKNPGAVSFAKDASSEKSDETNTPSATSPTNEKKNNYTIKEDIKLEDFITEYLKMSGIQNPTNEEIQKAIFEFIKNNPDAIDENGVIKANTPVYVEHGEYIDPTAYNNFKAGENKRIAEEKALYEFLESVSPATIRKYPGTKDSVTLATKERETKENKKFMEKIEKADDPAFAAKALLAASKGAGTNDVLFEAVLNAGKDLKYYEEIDKELQKQDTSLVKLVDSEYSIKKAKGVSEHEPYLLYVVNSEAAKFNYQNTNIKFVYKDTSMDNYYHRYDTNFGWKHFNADKLNSDGSYEYKGVTYNPDGTKKAE